jgi:hypothetical protein
VHSFKYLRIICDSNLSFREHINHMAEKCKVKQSRYMPGVAQRVPGS